MILDTLARFEPSALAVTTTAASTDSMDLGAARDIGAGEPDLYAVAIVGAAFTSATATATLTIQLQGAPNNGGVAGSWYTILSSPAIPLGQLAANSKILQVPIPILAQVSPTVISTTGTFSSGSTAVTAAVATVINGMFVSGTGIVPGTSVATGGGTTSLVLSDNTSAAGTAAALVFSSAAPLPRFLRMRYVASNTMTAGTIAFAGIVLDPEAAYAYAPGVTVPV